MPEVGFSTVQASPNNDGRLPGGKASNPPGLLSRGAPVWPPHLPANWPVPQAFRGPAYLSAETSSAEMAAVAVDSASIAPLRWRSSRQNSACEKTANSGRQTLTQGQKMADWRPRAAGPSHISGPFAPPIHFRIHPL